MILFLNLKAEILEIFVLKTAKRKKYHSKFNPLIRLINFDFVKKSETELKSIQMNLNFWKQNEPVPEFVPHVM